MLSAELLESPDQRLVTGKADHELSTTATFSPTKPTVPVDCAAPEMFLEVFGNAVGIFRVTRFGRCDTQFRQCSSELTAPYGDARGAAEPFVAVKRFHRSFQRQLGSGLNCLAPSFQVLGIFPR